MKAIKQKRTEIVEEDIEVEEVAEVVRTLAAITPHNATAARIVLELRFGKPEESRLDFRLTIVDPGGKDEGT